VRRAPLPEARIVRRALANETHAVGGTDADVAAAREFFATVDAATQEAYRYVLTVPLLGAYAPLDGHTLLWIDLISDHFAGYSVHLHTAFGYVVESLVSNPLSEFHAGAPGGYRVVAQVASGGTRPDLVLCQGDRQVAWVDLTASNSQGHIWSKESWSTKIGHFVEVTYPSLDSAGLALMKANENSTGTLDPAEFKATMEEAKRRHRLMQAAWRELGKNFRVGGRRFTPAQREQFSLDPSLKQTACQTMLTDHFGCAIDLAIVPSILAAMGIGSGTWGFTTGTSENVALGESWLIDHAPVTIDDAPAPADDAMDVVMS
jgi:hypothetical protein